MDAKSTGHRCDKCGVAALERWQHEATRLDLRFCAHHSRDYQLNLHAQGFRLVESRRAEPMGVRDVQASPPSPVAG